MSSVFVQIGQGGNQLGETFFNTVLRPEDIKRNRRCPAFQFLDNKLRSVNVDSERKVINQLKKNPLLRDENLICGLKGCGSNWAMGYYDSNCNLLAESLKIIQKESEKCEYFSGIVILHSISGGTGSVERIHYNTITTYCLFPVCKNMQMELHLSICKWLQPWKRTMGTPSTTLSSSKFKIYFYCSSTEKIFYMETVSNVLVGRGENEAYDFSQYVCKQQKQTERLLTCVQWVPDPVVYWTANSHLPGEKSSTLTAASNHGRVTHWLQMALDKAKAMYTAKAYLHWYWKYGADKSDFEKAFEATEIIIENYREVACMT
ncbi:TUBD [Acanthosepion pharaonis]|uniref:TUBD n=1 Tax=Acanthosepion pharaonis TaxID=158019 RepID=A0A812CGT6_ACAPH|nr:TUBD [Sepia pharaonis]